MNEEQGHLLDLREHCSRLSELLASPEFTFEHHRQVTTRDGETLDWLTASEWLLLASSIDRVEVDTTCFDKSAGYCESVLEFESKRSNLLSSLVAQLTVFNFVWGVFETIIKIIDPPPVPKSIKSNCSLIDAAIMYLKNEYEPARLLPFYSRVLADFRHILREIPHYGDLSQDFALQPFMGISGVGVHVVRKIRNKFAHGTLRMPMPEGWSLAKPLDVELIGLGTRIVLFTIQMLLLSYLKDDQFSVDWLCDYWCLGIADGGVHAILNELHIVG